MTVELATPPRNAERRKYKELIGKIVAANGEWLRISLDEIAPGCTVAIKQNRLLQAGKTRHVKLTTTAQGGALYARLRKERES